MLRGPVKTLALRMFELIRRIQRMPLCHLTTVGARTGRRRTVPLRAFADGDGWLVVASLGGARTNPAWLHNLAAHPDQAWLRVNGQTFPVSALTLSGAERDHAWSGIVRQAPTYDDYQAQTDRLIPVVRLRPHPTP